MSELPRATAGYLVDSNVLLDIFTEDERWYAWSATQVAHALRTGRVSINAIIYSEISARFESIGELDAVVPADLFRRDPLPFHAGFLAAKAFRSYRSRGGAKRSPLPDFYIGAHAVVHNLTLVTRDASRYRSYFPTLSVVAPSD